MTILVPEWLVAVVVTLFILTSLAETIVRFQKWLLKRRGKPRLYFHQTNFKFDPEYLKKFHIAGLDIGKTRDYTAYTLLGNWTPEDVEALKRYSLKTEASKILRDMAFPGDADGSYGTVPYSARKYSRAAENMLKLQRQIYSKDWTKPESALAWGIMYRPESGIGWDVVVASANGHVIMTSDEWWMITDRKEEFALDIALERIAKDVIQGFDRVFFPKTINLYPRYVMRPINLPPVMRHLKPTGNPPHPSAYELWRWNGQEWEVCTDETS